MKTFFILLSILCIPALTIAGECNPNTLKFDESQTVLTHTTPNPPRDFRYINLFGVFLDQQDNPHPHNTLSVFLDDQGAGLRYELFLIGLKARQDCANQNLSFFQCYTPADQVDFFAFDPQNYWADGGTLAQINLTNSSRIDIPDLTGGWAVIAKHPSGCVATTIVSLYQWE